MSATATAEELVVSVVPGVEQDPEVVEAISQATNAVRELLRKHHIDPAKRELIWGTSGEPPFQHVAAHLSEVDEYGRRQADRLFTRRRLLDPVSRKELVINLLLDVRGQRWSQVGEAIERGIEELEREEGANANAV